MIALRRILAPTDFSECAKRARSYATELAKRFDAELHMLHVVQPIALPTYVGPVLDNLHDLEEAARKELEEWEDPQFEPSMRLARRVVTGPPFVEILRYARQNEIDLIVVGTHGRAGLMHALVGSVAEKVVRKSPCPVLTVRPDEHQFVMP